MALAARAYVRERTRRSAPISKRVRRIRVRVAGRGARVTTFVAIPLALLLSYVWLTAELTAQTYRVHDAQARQTVLMARENDLRQQVAKLESLPRLEAAAARLHMRVPPGVALVAPAQPVKLRSAEAAWATSIADVRKWFGIR